MRTMGSPVLEDLLTSAGNARLSAMRWLLLLDGGVRLTLWCFSAVASTAIIGGLGLIPATRLSLIALVEWSWSLAAWVVLFNVVYLFGLIAMRSLIACPEEGVYPVRMGHGGLNPNILRSVLLGVVTKSRLEAPFPAFLLYHLSNLPPLCWLVERTLGPRSGSCQFADPYVLDPHLIEIGRDVVIGFHAIISAHVQVNDTVIYRKIVIEDGAVIGANAAILAGARIGRGALIGLGALVMPDTQVGAFEFWAGVPAKKIRDLASPEAAEVEATQLTSA